MLRESIDRDAERSPLLSCCCCWWRLPKPPLLLLMERCNDEEEEDLFRSRRDCNCSALDTAAPSSSRSRLLFFFTFGCDSCFLRNRRAEEGKGREEEEYYWMKHDSYLGLHTRRRHEEDQGKYRKEDRARAAEDDRGEEGCTRDILR